MFTLIQRDSVIHSFINAILADPADDTVRLTFADWLDEHEQPDRAEFIRIQVKLARALEDDPSCKDLRSRENELLAIHKTMWLGEKVEVAPPSCWEFRRGFPEVLILTSAIEMSRIASTISSPHLSGVFFIDLSFNEISGSRTSALTTAPRPPHLTRLYLSGNGINDIDIAELSNSEIIQKLSSFRVDLNQIGDAGAQSLAFMQADNLTELCLSWNNIGDAGAIALGESPRLVNLCNLALCRNQISAAGVTGLAASPQLSRIRILDLSGNSIGDAGAEALAHSNHLSELTNLNLSWCQISDIGAKILAESPRLARLKTLDIRCNQLSDECVSACKLQLGARLVF
ncbi:leucine-rich repeat-containing protein typical subtype : Leucine-rich repeat-containing protein typical subtype OS=Herpetosiphon aurantiacus (strain ATCC 23779 / DSM 785) GN=Haur_4051 PE=4 SV=1: LRR_6: LRR_6: LRR_6: LRR_6: LRR_6: LRR_6 [Gemmata massiliana]|uniref:Repeat-companion domain protein n=1 Tax=Gemmata massiliana TaxID=1210884 RepID=A0A6P2DL76_9BACT|nr:TIGR02996 domain-containing protein [Gemmata massiliana]VTS01326.1 leucine-rich repeat-containing protein typical subtype : Leucine-rich repeat-containing protein typical subtype OS=Herpetosiphon aurantiacus (strain ATCC 23779 / DSM 785) GN=Haur_4051 PE=4 SV=1: LRR_6: LRR_6: LRR_6: LRR_6: LRR_6: LRR_6 [Gemmata massiliana]